jgi:hypothetical protein
LTLKVSLCSTGAGSGLRLKTRVSKPIKLEKA